MKILSATLLLTVGIMVGVTAQTIRPISIPTHFNIIPHIETAEDRENLKYEKAKKLVLERLGDPESAKFKDLYMRTDDTVCGYVNSKNRMGGYTGFTLFKAELDEEALKMRMKPDPQVFFEDSLGDTFEGRWAMNAMCGKKYGH